MAALDETQLVGLLEAVYALELDDQQWLGGALSALSRLCGRENHYFGFFYDASSASNFQVSNLCADAARPELMPSLEAFRAALADSDFVRLTFRSLYTASARRDAGPLMEPVLAERRRAGWGDTFNINGLDVSGLGCLLTLGCRAPEYVVDHQQEALYRRLAIHLGTAFRCRRKLAASRASAEVGTLGVTTGAEAILDGNGHFVHAQGQAASKLARERIRAAAAAIDAVRTKPREGGHGALDTWRPLTGARWTLVDSFEENGKRYVVARENQIEVDGLLALTDRERQVAVHAALGLSNKQIAYTLGVSHATVRVLMARAARRLGVNKRRELLEHAALRGIERIKDAKD